MSEEFIPREENQTAAGVPEQKYFKIAEASTLLGVKPHVLRYWETEFPQIRPYKSKSGQRLYRRRDFEALKHIHKLLYQERYTIAGARQALRLMYENDAPIIEDVALSEEAIEAAVAPVFVVQAPAAVEIVPEVVSPLATQSIPESPAHVEMMAAPVQTVTRDVLDIVEEKMAQSQIADRLFNVRKGLNEMIAALSA